jgi:tRNA(adenine34) deaminase
MHIPPCPFQPFDETTPVADRTDYYLRCAFNEALKAWAEGEVPVGAIGVMPDGTMVRGHNRSEQLRDPTAHAEIQVIRTLCAHTKDWRLPNCELYVTQWPCPMCMGTIARTRLSRIVIGYDPIAPSECTNGTVHPCQFEVANLNECATLLTTYFRLRRTC